MPEWSKGHDSSSCGFGRVGSNPTRSTDFIPLFCSLNDPAHLIASSSCTPDRLPFSCVSLLFFFLLSLLCLSYVAVRVQSACRGPARQIAPLLFFFFLRSCTLTLKRKEKKKKKEKQGGVWGSPPTLKLFSSPLRRYDKSIHPPRRDGRASSHAALDLFLP